MSENTWIDRMANFINKKQKELNFIPSGVEAKEIVKQIFILKNEKKIVVKNSLLGMVLGLIKTKIIEEQVKNAPKEKKNFVKKLIRLFKEGEGKIDYNTERELESVLLRMDSDDLVNLLYISST